MKRCFKCLTEKPLSDFYKHPKMADGHLGKCKECTKKDVFENREVNKDYYLDYDRNRPNREERVKQTCERVKNLRKLDKEFCEKVNSSKAAWESNNPDKRKAQHAANNAVRDGKLPRKLLCEHCGSGVSYKNIIGLMKKSIG